ncbi:MAG: aggregation factor core [Pseudomonadota bacterium]
MIRMLRNLISVAAVTLAASMAHATTSVTAISIVFSESAPKDSFTITNTGACKAADFSLRIDLASSKGRLIFDTTAKGAGVEVFQPLEITAGEASLASISKVRDGSRDVALELRSLAPGGKIAFTVDVDDTLPRSELGQTRVADSEISGAEIHGKSRDGFELKSAFGDNATAQLKHVPCA